jgi:Protein  of unknown function (DUF3018)
MPAVENTSDTRERMSAYRARLRAAGLRPVQIWVPDVRAPRLAEEVRRQSLLASCQPADAEALAFIEEAADIGEHP